MWGFRKKSKQEKAVDSHRARVLSAMKEDAEAAGIFADFIVEALNRGYAMRVIVEVDGVTCPSGLLFPSGDFVEYMANWACAQKITKGIKARKFEMQGWGQEGGGGVESVSGTVDLKEAANLGAIDKNDVPGV